MLENKGVHWFLVLNEMKVYTCRIIVCWTVPQGTCYLIKSGNAPDLFSETK